jgi:hypothetical protein
MAKVQSDRLHLGTEQNRIQDKTEGMIRPLADNPLMNGRLVEVSLTTSFQNINHKLGRPFKGYFVVKTNALIKVPQFETSSNDSLYLRLKSDTAANVTLLVF